MCAAFVRTNMSKTGTTMPLMAKVCREGRKIKKQETNTEHYLLHIGRAGTIKRNHQHVLRCRSMSMIFVRFLRVNISLLFILRMNLRWMVEFCCWWMAATVHCGVDRPGEISRLCQKLLWFTSLSRSTGPKLQFIAQPWQCNSIDVYNRTECWCKCASDGK